MSTERKHKRRLYQYWYEHFPDYQVIWQVVPDELEHPDYVTLMMIAKSGDHDYIPGDEIPFDTQHFNCDEYWTPVRKEDVPLIILSIV